MGFPVKDMNATALADKDQTPVAVLIYFHRMIAIAERVIGLPCFHGAFANHARSAFCSRDQPSQLPLRTKIALATITVEIKRLRL
ncbi:hypothetical protein HUU39_10215 [candidate division KSB1 bacterium]|nr:hypothetical protein [bacterium]NUM65631.1 hypothetical protein [candidate division KSB1 bacterium]